jgi:hypothetical protein
MEENWHGGERGRRWCSTLLKVVTAEGSSGGREGEGASAWGLCVEEGEDDMGARGGRRQGG